MKIWIDIINTPQVSFFIPFIRDFKLQDHDVLLTCRDSGNTVELLKQNQLYFNIVGQNVRRKLIQKLLFFPVRLFKLYTFIRKNKPDIAASQSSFYQPVIARMFKIPCLYTNDNEHAKGNLLGFLFANKVVLPQVLRDKNFAKRWPLKDKVSFYPGVKEAIYLSQNEDLIQHFAKGRDRIYFRPEPWSAQYYNGKLNFFDDTLIKLADDYKVVVLPRDRDQADHYLQKKFAKLTIAQKPLKLTDIISDCLLFIGAGGSMTRELAVLEIPVISVYQDEILSVDTYLVNRGLMKIAPDISYEKIKNGISFDAGNRREFCVLNEGKDSYLLVKDLIINKLTNG